MGSPFDVLGVDPDADEAEIERAYRRRVKEAHPDHGGSTSDFRAVQAAYERLTDDYGARRRADDVDGDRTADSDADDRADPAATAAAGRERDDGPTPVDCTVEYLDYEALDDHGWAVSDPTLFRKAVDADLEPAAHGEFSVPAGETVLDAAEAAGETWPFACRGGACANCAVAVVEGEMALSVDHVLPEALLARGIRLSCIGRPTTPELKLVYNVKHLPDLEELRLPPGPFAGARSDD